VGSFASLDSPFEPAGVFSLIMEPRVLLLILALFLPALTVAQAPEKKPAAPAPSRDVLALIGDRPVTEAEIEALAGERLARIRAEEYAIKRQVLDEYILQALMEKEALTQIETNLVKIRLQDARKRFIDSLKQNTPVRILFAPPRVAIDSRSEPSRGPETAPVTLVAFSDYQCPYCSRFEPTLRQLERKYGNRLRVVHRDFPLSQIHPNAVKAAEAAECARDQGKFWEMHDRLFANQQALSLPDLKKAASELTLDSAKFGECLDSGAKAAEWQKDLRDGEQYGVSGTPTVFVNGRLIRGASTVESISAIVDEELQTPGGLR